MLQLKVQSFEPYASDPVQASFGEVTEALKSSPEATVLTVRETMICAEAIPSNKYNIAH